MRSSRPPSRMRGMMGAIAVACAVATAGCSSAGADSETNGSLTEITIAEQGKAGLTTGALPHLADELGYFEDEGLAVDEYVVVTASGDAISGMLSGEVEFSHTGAEGFMAAAQGGEIIGIGANTDASIWTVVAAPGISDWSQLRGKTIALGSTADVTRAVFDRLAKQAGLNPKKDLEYVALGATPQRVAAVQQGQAAATIAAYPSAGRVIGSGLTDLGFAPKGTEPPQLMTTEIAASKRWAEAHPEETASYLRAIKKATDFAKDPENSDEVAEILSGIGNESPEEIIDGLDRYYIDPTPKGAFYPEDFHHAPGTFEATVESYRDLGLFNGEISEDQYMDYTYADMAMEK